MHPSNSTDIHHGFAGGNESPISLSEVINAEFSPSKVELVVCAEEVDVVPELQFEDMVLADAILFCGHSDFVTQQRQTGQWTVILSATNDNS